MSRIKKSPPRSVAANPLSPDAQRLLRGLAAGGAYGYTETPDDNARVAVAAPRNGVSIRVASHTSAAAALLCAADLAQWRQHIGGKGRLRLIVTDAGRAHLSRATAPEGLDPFTAQHTPVVRRPAEDASQGPDVLVDQAESPLVWLATRKSRDGQPLIDVNSLEAGERLRRDLTLAQILPRVTANWSASIVDQGAGGAMQFSDLVIAARQRVDLALRAVGPEFSGLLVDICGFLKGLETIETERGWPRRSAKVVLVLALRQLQRHYGIETRAIGPSQSRGVRHWGAEDFRPRLDAGST